MAENKNEKTILTYKGKPLMRKDNEIYYGNVEDKYRIYLELDETTELMGLDIATHVNVYLQTNDIPGKAKIIKKAERDGLYAALDLGEYWLTDILTEQ